MFEINAVIDNKRITYPDYNYVQNLNIVQGEANVTKIIFKVLNTELSQKDIKCCNLRQINYENDKGEQHVSMITDIEFEPDFTLFSWNINGLFTALQGKSRFSVSFGNIIEDKITVLFSTLYSEIRIAKSIMADGDHVTVDATEMQKVLADINVQAGIATSKATIATEQATVAVQKAAEATEQATDAAESAAEAESSAKRVEHAVTKNPYINPINKNWMIWDLTLSKYVDSGQQSEGNILYATFQVADGILMMSTPERYKDISFKLNGNGELEVEI